MGRHLVGAVAQPVEPLPPPDQVPVHHPAEAGLLLLLRWGDQRLLESCLEI